MTRVEPPTAITTEPRSFNRSRANDDVDHRRDASSIARAATWRLCRVRAAARAKEIGTPAWCNPTVVLEYGLWVRNRNAQTASMQVTWQLRAIKRQRRKESQRAQRAGSAARPARRSNWRRVQPPVHERVPSPDKGALTPANFRGSFDGLDSEPPIETPRNAKTSAHPRRRSRSETPGSPRLHQANMRLRRERLRPLPIG